LSCSCLNSWLLISVRVDCLLLMQASLRVRPVSLRGQRLVWLLTSFKPHSSLQVVFLLMTPPKDTDRDADDD
jgi:hypothetical protein